jgi:hypothetical protein
VARAIRNCIDNNVLVIAPAGNDKGECFCVPAAIPGVIAVGASDNEGRATRFSNWGGIYQKQGILAPGVEITGAAPGGKTSIHKGTSCAAPIVTGVAGLLMSVQLSEGWPINASKVRDAILSSAIPCDASQSEEQQRCLTGLLNIPDSVKQLFALSSAEKRSLGSKPTLRVPAISSAKTRRLHSPPKMPFQNIGATVARGVPSPHMVGVSQSGVSPSGACACEGDGKGLVFFIGLVDYDFGTEARRDTFKQQMPPVLYRRRHDKEEFEFAERFDAKKIQRLIEQEGYLAVPANPYDPRQMAAYLKFKPYEACSLTWILKLELTPVYNLKPVGPFANEVYETLVEMLRCQSEPAKSDDYVERVSVPAVLSGESVRLFSGQEVSQVLVDAPRGMYAWKTTDLVKRARPIIEAAQTTAKEGYQPPPGSVLTKDPETIVREMLNKLYYQYRNLGITSPDRALNYAATNIFQITDALANAIQNRKTLDQIDVVKSPYGRVDSDCWDVMLKFMDPENMKRAYSVIRFTLDVSDKLPVTMGDLIHYTSST